jgi:tRNA threonylcarbamoyladenosine biosynthesis protein TsaB
MYLIINTAENNKISLSLKDGETSIDEISIESKFTQAEKLLPLIDEILVKNNKKLTDIKKIGVANRGEGFTSLRIGVITANALGYALGVPVFSVSDEKTMTDAEFDVIKPVYSREPNIT